MNILRVFFLLGGGEGANLSPKNSKGSSARAVLVMDGGWWMDGWMVDGMVTGP